MRMRDEGGEEREDEAGGRAEGVEALDEEEAGEG